MDVDAPGDGDVAMTYEDLVHRGLQAYSVGFSCGDDMKRCIHLFRVQPGCCGAGVLSLSPCLELRLCPVQDDSVTFRSLTDSVYAACVSWRHRTRRHPSIVSSTQTRVCGSAGVSHARNGETH